MKKSYVISVSLETGCYRHIQIAADSTLDALHSAILNAFDFYDDHLHVFFMDNQLWNEWDAYYDARIEEEGYRYTCDYKLNHLHLEVGKKFKFVFDLGDEWTFQCKVLRIVQEETKKPMIIRSKGEVPDQYYCYDEEEDYSYDEDEDEEEEEPVFNVPQSQYDSQLYDLAFAYKKTKLWKQLYDSEIFAVQLSDDEIGYCCVMGKFGEHIALGLYVSDKGWNSYLSLSNVQNVETELEYSEYIESLMSQDCIQCAFENKEELTEEAVESVRAYAKEHGVVLRGKNAYPQFVRYQPHHLPWNITKKKDADQLALALKAAIEVAKQLESTKNKLAIGIVAHSETVPLLVPKEDGFSWKTTQLPERIEESYLAPSLEDTALAEKIVQMEKTGGKWECELLYAPNPVQGEEGEAPYFPFFLLVVDTKQEEMIPIVPKLYYEKYAQEMLSEFAEAILNYGTCPKSITVCDERTELFLKDFCRTCGILMLRAKEFTMLDEWKEEIFENLSDEDGMDEAMLDTIIETMLSLDDDEFRKIPHELLEQLSGLLGSGVFPPELEDRLNGLLEERR